MARNYGEVTLNIVDCKVCTYNIFTGAQGAAVDVPEIQSLNMALEIEDFDIMAEGFTTHLAAVVKEATFELPMAGISPTAFAVLTGMTAEESGTTPNRHNVVGLTTGSTGFPYFSLAGKMVGENSDDAHFGLIACKLNSLDWEMAQNTFLLSNSSGRAIARESDRKLMFIKYHETSSNISISDLFA